MRLEFVAIDLNLDGDSTDVDEGFFRVYVANAGGGAPHGSAGTIRTPTAGIGIATHPRIGWTAQVLPGDRARWEQLVHRRRSWHRRARYIYRIKWRRTSTPTAAGTPHAAAGRALFPRWRSAPRLSENGGLAGERGGESRSDVHASRPLGTWLPWPGVVAPRPRRLRPDRTAGVPGTCSRSCAARTRARRASSTSTARRASAGTFAGA